MKMANTQSTRLVLRRAQDEALWRQRWLGLMVSLSNHEAVLTAATQSAYPITSTPPMYGTSAFGTSTLPSSRW
jgi:hypothetical protein